MDDEQKTARTRELARQIWEAEGRPDGHSARHWQMAERLVAAELEAAQYDQQVQR
ncbi:DUF2934 domain-containing protein [Stenotrophomonas sp. NPDC077464]|uniref:DUF2934 domain-containing protein n=1 Tax=unclassified Stenotrophomonas TaxID=196198 RepID=UPI0037CFF085